ncbi:hypothetical protein FACS189431_2120 [Alphaproteobacteria bacterium]|nr:hypothetical protein FACS189431_2120 [Alphaproteobacteria bacterium]
MSKKLDDKNDNSRTTLLASQKSLGAYIVSLTKHIPKLHRSLFGETIKAINSGNKIALEIDEFSNQSRRHTLLTELNVATGNVNILTDYLYYERAITKRQRESIFKRTTVIHNFIVALRKKYENNQK